MARVIAAGALAFAASATALSARTSATDECFDALILAEITAQVPSDVPDSDDDALVITSWPHFIDLKVERVIKGSVAEKKITALAVQHTYYRTDLGKKTWWLRRNSEGSFNLLDVDKRDAPLQCRPGTPPARSHLIPGEGSTLEDLRRKGETRYGVRR